MLHKKAVAIANSCVSRGWVKDSELDWCVYAAEKWILFSAFLLLLLLWMCVSGKYIETLSFACTFYVLRSRIGGCHAKLPWLCITASIVIVITITILIGPLLSRIPLLPSLIGSFLIYIVAYFTKPIYPPQASFTREAIVENNKKKNQSRLLGRSMLLSQASPQCRYYVEAGGLIKLYILLPCAILVPTQ